MEHLGSNLERLVRSTKLPVLVAARAFKPIQKIVVAFDGGASSMKAIEHLAASSVFKDLHCLLLHVGTESSVNHQQLEGAVAVLKNAGIKAHSKSVVGQADTVISNTVEQDEFDLLVMGAYGHSRIRNLIIGSTTTQMLASCKVPVLLFR